MEEITFTYAGFNSAEDLNLIVNEIKRGVLGDVSEITQDIPAKIGTYFLGNKYSSKKIEIECTMKTDTEEERQSLTHELANLFFSDGNDEFDLVLSDESQYAYHAHVTNISTPERISQTNSWSKFTITFTCSIPYAFGEQIKLDVDKETFTYEVEGTAKTYPVISIIPTKDVTEIAVANADGDYVFLGQGENTESGSTYVNKEPLILHDECNTLATWTKITSDNLKFSTENVYFDSKTDLRATTNTLRIALKNGEPYFGDLRKDTWHGAGRFLQLPIACKDWQLRVRLYNNEKSYRARNKIEVYLLDESGDRMAKMMLKDNDESRQVVASCDIGTSTSKRKIIFTDRGTISKVKGKKSRDYTKTVSIITKQETVKHAAVKKTKTTKAKKAWTETVNTYKTLKLDYDFSYSTYTDFYGWLQLRKVGNDLKFDIMKLKSNGQADWTKTKTKSYNDKTTKYIGDKKLAMIACVISKWDNPEDSIDGINSTEDNKIAYEQNDMAICDVMVWNIIDGGNKANSQPPIIAYKGEQVVIDSQTNRIFKNGVPIMETLNIGSTFFEDVGRSTASYSFYPTPKNAEIFIEYTPSIY